MEQEKKTYRKRRWIKWLAAAVIIFLLAAGGRYALQSDRLFDIVRDKAVEQINQQINGTASIESIRGDLLHGFVIKNVNVDDERQNRLATIDSISISYRLMSLVRSPHEIDEITISGTDLFVEQLEDSTWNVLNLLIEREERDEPGETFWSAQQIRIQNLNTEVKSEYLLPDGILNIDQLEAELSVGMLETGFSGMLSSLEFNLRDARLPEPVEVYLAGSGSDERITLESLAINTGRTLLKASADYRELENQVTSELEISPLAWQDLLQYVDDAPLQQNLNIRIGAEGTLENLILRFSAEADGLEHLDLEVAANLIDAPSVHQADITIRHFDLPLLTGIPDLPTFQSIQFGGKGHLSAEEFELANWEGQLNLTGISYDAYQLDDFTLDYALADGNLDLMANLALQDQQINLVADVQNLFDEMPGWQTEISSQNLNLAIWLNNEELDSDLNLDIAMRGSGFDTERFESEADININGNRFGDQAFSGIHFNGTLNQDELSGLFRAQLDRSVLETRFAAREWMQIPDYEFRLDLKEFNAAEINGLEFFPTYLNGTLEGQGTAIDPEQLSMMATAYFDSSIVNGEEIETLKADFRISDQFLFIDDGQLESPMADASFSVRQHLSDLTNRENRLNFEAFIKNINPLAPLAGADRLHSEGTISGVLARNEFDQLEFNGDFDLEQVEVDTVFSSSRISGSLKAFVRDEPEISLEVELLEPLVNGMGVQDVKFNTNAVFREHETAGSLGFSIINGTESSITHSGDFRVDSLAVRLTTNSLLFKADSRELSLVEPFDITYINDVLRVDTLTISSPQDDAFMTLWVPHLDSLKQHAGIDAQNLDLGELQQTIIQESYFEGILSGDVEVYRTSDSLEVSATGLLSHLRFEEGEMDSLRFDADLSDEWLNTSFHGWHLGNRLVEAEIRIPFVPGDPLTFDEQFFERTIAGHFDLFETDLRYWLSFTPDGAPEQTEGRLSVRADLSGIAGSPELTGTITVTDALFSGISIDSVGVDLAYLHEEEIVGLQGAVIKDQNPILSFDSRLPFLFDLRQGEILLPSDDDSISVNLMTDNFDLALLNSYIDQDVIRQISGRLEGSVSLTGVMGDLEPRGRMQLSRGSMRIVEAGITLTEMASTIELQPDRVNLQQFTVRSGPGRLRAMGSVDLDNLTPGNLNFELSANQFRVFNTPDMNAIVNLQSGLTGTVAEPDLTGSLTFLSGFVNLQNFGDRAVEDVTLEDEIEPGPSEFFEALAMELSVNFTRNFFIRNRQYLDMEIELGGQVDLVKQRSEDIQMFGTLEGVRGFARPLGKNFVLDEAVLSFSGPIRNPELNIRTMYEPPQAAGVRIYYIIDGNLEDPNFRFDSEPALELQDIVSYTLFGKPFYELESWEQVVAGSGTSPTAADFALDILLDRVEMLASQRLGIDVVQIDNTRSGSSSTTSIKTGWYLNQRTFFAILNEVGGQRPKTLFMLEYLLHDNLELIITQGDDSREGIDLRWKYDY